MTTCPAGSLNGLLGYLADTRAPVVVVGGMAVIVHGYVRATGDVDVVMAEGPETAQWLRRVVVDLEVDEDLRLMKELAGRLQDRLDLEHLRDVHGTLPPPPAPAD